MTIFGLEVTYYVTSSPNMHKIDILNTIYKTNQNIFSLKELSLMFPSIKYVNLKRRLNNLVKKNKILSPTRGIYTKDNYSVAELALKLYSPSYLSLETVLVKEGVIFQEYNSTYVISYKNRVIKINGHNIIYKRLRSEILLNNLGVEKKDNYAIATKERAFTDSVHLYGNYHFDNLSTLNWNLVLELSSIYKNKKTKKRITDYYKLSKKDHV